MSMIKIFHWVFGSFFRTLGRFLCYLIIGVILALILSSTKLPKVSDIFSDLFFMKVDALTYDGTVSRLIQVWNQDQTIFLETQYSSDYKEIYKQFTYSFNSNNDDFITFPIVGGTYNLIDYQGDNSSYYYIANNVIFQVSLLSDVGGNNKVCEIQNNLLVCPMNKNATYTMLQFKTYNSETYTHTNWEIDLSIGAYPTLYRTISNQQIQNDNNNTQSIINNQNQNNQAINNTLTDSNITKTEGEASSFFSNFSTSDNGGLSSIITAPLSAIQSLTSSTCSPLVLPLPYINQNLTLPCMRTIYEENFGGFIVIYDVITIGIISYWILVRIFNLVKDFKNPDHDEIEVVDL